MPPVNPRPSGRFRLLRRLTLAFLVVAALAGWASLSLGRLLHHEDPLERADAIFVLGGSRLERVVESGDLYLEGHAPLVVVAPELPDTGEQALRARGITVPSATDVHLQALTAMGVPRGAIYVIDPQMATATEAVALRHLAAERSWRTVIIVTQRLHTARARLVITRRVSDLGVRIIMRSSRYDQTDPERWWSDRASFRFALFEAQKMLAYWVGLAD